MLKTFFVAWREFLAAVLTKGFLLGIILPPAIAGVALTLMPLLMNAAAPKTTGRIAVIDQTGGAGAGLVSQDLSVSLSEEAFKKRRAEKLDKAAEKLQSSGMPVPPMDNNTKAMANAAMNATAPELSVEILPPDTDVEAAKKPILEANVRNADAAGQSQRVVLVVIPEAAVRPAAPPTTTPTAASASTSPAGEKAGATSTATPAPGAGGFQNYSMFVAPKLDIEVQGDIRDEVRRAIIAARLRVANLDPAQVLALTSDPRSDTKVVTPEGERNDSGVATILLPGAFLVLLWVSVLVGGQGLLMSTVEEKSSRVMEVLLSAVSPMQLMVGKIIGQMAVASVILVLYAATGVGSLIVFKQGHLLDPMLLVYTAFYFVIAFFFMASMMAAIGSAVNDIREAQALMQPIMIVMIIPMMLWMPISRNPNGLFAQIVSFVPPISPFVMVIRLAGSEKIPAWQIPLSMVIGIASVLFMCWAAAKIFRIGVLMYGKPPNMRTLLRWIRMA